MTDEEMDYLQRMIVEAAECVMMDGGTDDEIQRAMKEVGERILEELEQ